MLLNHSFRTLNDQESEKTAEQLRDEWYQVILHVHDIVYALILTILLSFNTHTTCILPLLQHA